MLNGLSMSQPQQRYMAYGMDKAKEGDSKIVVYDLGGGTFDVSIEIADVDGEKCWSSGEATVTQLVVKTSIIA